MASTQCLPIDAGTTPTLWLGGMAASNAEVFARLYLTVFSDAGCNTPTGFTDFAFITSSTAWQPILGAVAIPAGTFAVRMNADAVPSTAGLPQFTTAFDNLYVGTEPLVFADGFEIAGSTCAWSTTVGGP